MFLGYEGFKKELMEREELKTRIDLSRVFHKAGASFANSNETRFPKKVVSKSTFISNSKPGYSKRRLLFRSQNKAQNYSNAKLAGNSPRRMVDLRQGLEDCERETENPLRVKFNIMNS